MNLVLLIFNFNEWRRRCEGRMQESFDEKAMKTTVRSEERRSFARACYHCKQEGHLRRNCPVLMAERRHNQAKSMVVKQSDAGSSGSSRGVCFTTTTASDVSIDGRWIIDTGCSKHMTGSTVSFDSMTFSEEKVTLVDGRTVKARGSGQGRITGAVLEGEAVDMKLNGLLYVPGLSGSVLSVSRITSNGYDVMFGAKDCRI